MSTESTSPDPAELIQELSSWAVGGGLITVALFPFALPLILLTAAAAIPLLLVGLVLGLIAAPFLLLRRLLRRTRAPRRQALSSAAEEEPRAPAAVFRPGSSRTADTGR